MSSGFDIERSSEKNQKFLELLSSLQASKPFKDSCGTSLENFTNVSWLLQK